MPLASPVMTRMFSSRSRRAVGLVYGGLFAAVAATALVAAVSDEIRVKDLARDPATLSGAPATDGVLTWLSAFAWSATIAVVVLGAWILRRLGAPDRPTAFLLGSAGVTAVLGLDDVFLGHERVGPAIGIGEEVLFLAYGVGYLLFVRRFSDVLRDTALPLLAVALVFFGGALVVAFGPAPFGDPPFWLLPDTYTFLGAGAWFAYHLHTVLTWTDARLVLGRLHIETDSA